MAWLSEKKSVCLSSAELICNGCPREYHSIYEDLMKLTYYDAPNYSSYINALQAVMTRKSIPESTPLDWEPEADMYRLIDQKVAEGNLLHENKGVSKRTTG